MEKNFEVNPELEEMREQFRMLTEKVEKQNIVTEQLMKEVSKKKIQRFEFWAYWIFYVVGSVAGIVGIIDIFQNGHPLWTSFSFVYMLLLFLVMAISRWIKNRRYLSRINYDLTTYWKDEESSCQKKMSIRAACFMSFILAPIFIHGRFLFNYLISANEIRFLGDHCGPYIILLVFVAFTGVYMLKKYIKILLRLFK